MADMQGLGVLCGRCSSPILMVTCNMFSGSGHAWVICSACPGCRLVAWTNEGCLDCREAEVERG